MRCRRASRRCEAKTSVMTAPEREALTLTRLMRDLAEDLTEATAIAKAAVACAEAGAEAEAARITLRLDVPLSEAQTLHGALCLLARRARAAQA